MRLLDRLDRELGEGAGLVVIFDYDGTLTPLVSSPGAAFLAPSEVLRGQFEASFDVQLLLSIPVALLGFGILSLLPIPPLDGFGLLWSAMRRPGEGMQTTRLWLDHKNLGVVILLACCFFPLSAPLLLLPLDLLGTVFLRLWA